MVHEALETIRVFGGELVVVNAVNDRQVDALGRGGDQHLLRARCDMLLGACAVGEEAGALQSDFDAIRLVRKVGGIALGGHVNALAVDDDVVPVGRYLARELAVDAVVLEQPGIGLGVGEVVDRHELQSAVGPLEDRAGDQPADAAEAVDCNFRH